MDNSKLIVHSNAEDAANAQLREAAKKTYTERFHTLMRLIRISSMISNSKIIESPKIKDF
jgi:hypothetical protein